MIYEIYRVKLLRMYQLLGKSKSNKTELVNEVFSKQLEAYSTIHNA